MYIGCVTFVFLCIYVSQKMAIYAEICGAVHV
jgi:hypothetical protein